LSAARSNGTGMTDALRYMTGFGGTTVEVPDTIDVNVNQG
jgi:hypothetical protein